MVHEQKFKDLLSSTCQVSVERIVLDLESEVMRGLGSIPTGGNIMSLEFFSYSEAPMPTLALLPMLCVCENPESVATEIQNTSIDLVLIHIGQQRQITEEKDISELKEPQTSIDTMPCLRSQQETRHFHTYKTYPQTWLDSNLSAFQV